MEGNILLFQWSSDEIVYDLWCVIKLHQQNVADFDVSWRMYLDSQ